MDRFKLYFLIIISQSILVGCKDGYDPSVNLQPSLTGRYLRVSQSAFTHMSSQSFRDEFKIECSETTWGFSEMPDWIAVSPSHGNTSGNVLLEGSENFSDPRSAVFYLRSEDSGWDYNKAMSVSQGGVDVSLTVEPNELSFSGKGEDKRVLVIANCEWTAKCSQDWISLEKIDNSELSVIASANPADSYRESTVYVNYGGNRTEAIGITQFPSAISSSDAVLKYGCNASRYEITVTSEVEWSAETSDNWIMVDPSMGAQGETRVSIEVSPNSSVGNRTGFVLFKTGDYERFQIEIEQEGLYIETVDELTFRSMGGSQDIEVRSNTDWEVISSPDWISFSKTSGSGNSAITVTASENQNMDARSGVIELGQKGLSLVCGINVSQLGRTLEADTAVLEFTDKGGEQTFGLISDGEWSSSCSDPWFSASPVSGFGDATVSVSVEENTGETEREGVITYSYGNQSTEVLIHQLGKYFTIDNDTFEFGSKGGTHTIDLSTNEKWTASVEGEAEWLTLSAKEGEGSSEIILTADDNPSVNGRSAEIVITPANSQAVKVFVTQSARYLTVSSESISFFSDGGTSAFVSIDTDGVFKIESDGDWFTVNLKDDMSGFTVTAESFKQPEKRTGKITISLTDLEEGTMSLGMSVIQIGEGCSFIIEGYPEDGDWNDFGNSSLQFIITGYQSDQNWDSKNESKIVITVTGYKDDSDWNTDKKAESDFGREDYTQDQDWNNK